MKNRNFENFKNVVNMSWESIFLGFMMPILPNLTSDLARSRVNKPKQGKSTIIFSDLNIPWFTIKRPVSGPNTAAELYTYPPQCLKAQGRVMI